MSDTGVLSGTPNGGLGQFAITVSVVDTSLPFPPSTDQATASYTLTIYPSLPPLTITSPSSLPANAYEGVAYPPIQFTAIGGSGTGYTWSVYAPELPGLTMSTTGVLSGTPNGGFGLSAITVTVEDSVGDTASETYSVIFSNESQPLAIVYPSYLPNADLNMGYSVGFFASGGTPPYTWSVYAPSLPGLIMSPAGVLSGTPALAGVFAVTVTVTDSFGYPTSAIYSLTVASPMLTISAVPGALTIPQGQSGETTLTFTPTGGYVGPVTLSCSGLPANTSCSFAQLPSGTPITSLTFSGQPVMVQLTIWTDGVSTQHLAQSSPAPPRPGAILAAIVFWSPFSLLGLIALRRKRKLFTKNPRIFGLCVFVLLAGAMAGLAGCISGGGFGTYVTPVGTSTVTVVATPASGSAQTVSISLTITQQ